MITQKELDEAIEQDEDLNGNVDLYIQEDESIADEVGNEVWPDCEGSIADVIKECKRIY